MPKVRANRKLCTILLVPLTMFLVATVAAPAQAKFQLNKSVATSSGGCGLKSSGGIACIGTGIDTYGGMRGGHIDLRRKGKAKVSTEKYRINHSTDANRQLRKGDHWNKRGVRCKITKSHAIRCTNGKHGFKLGIRRFKIF